MAEQTYLRTNLAKEQLEMALCLFLDNESITEDLEYSAFWILSRACQNALKLGISIKRDDEFEIWFQENILGVGDWDL